MIYVDSSALVRLVLNEVGWEALAASLDGNRMYSSELTTIETIRSVARHRPDAVVRAREWLERVDLLRISPSVVNTASTLTPETLRSLDAIHVATALELSDELEFLVSYDVRMLEAASAHGISVASPV